MKTKWNPCGQRQCVLSVDAKVSPTAFAFMPHLKALQQQLVGQQNKESWSRLTWLWRVPLILLLNFLIRKACWRKERHFKELPVNALSSQAGSGQNLLNMGQPIGCLQLTQPAVHIMWLVIAGFHQLDEAFLKDIVSTRKKRSWIFTLALQSWSIFNGPWGHPS